MSIRPAQTPNVGHAAVATTTIRARINLYAGGQVADRQFLVLDTGLRRAQQR